MTKKRKRIWLLFTIFQLIYVDTLYSEKSIDKITYSPFPEVYFDNTDTISINNIQTVHFNKSANYFLNFGFTKASCWIKFNIQNKLPANDFLYFGIRNHYLEYVDVYLLDNDKIIKQYYGGCKRSKIFPLKINLQPQSTISVVIKVKSQSPLRIPIYLNTPDEMYNYKSNTGLFNGIYYGFFLLVSIIIFYITIVYKDRLSLYFLLSVVSIVFFNLAYDDYIPFLNTFSEPDILLRICTSAIPLVFLGYIGFSEAFFDVKNKTISNILNALRIYSLIHLILYIVDYNSGNKFTYFAFPIFALILFITSIYVWVILKKHYVRLYVLATFVLICGVFFHLLSNFGIITNIYFSQYSFKTGYTLQIIVYLIAVVERYIYFQKNFTRILKEKVDERTSEYEYINDKLRLANEELKHYQFRLEETVEERTKELQKLTLSLQTLINESPLAIFDVDSEGKVLSVWNPSSERIFGWTAEEAIGNSIPYLDDTTLEGHLRLLERVKKGELISYVELKRKNKNGHEIYIRASLIPVFNPSGGIDRIIAFIDNITDRKKMRDAIIESESKFRTLFLSSRLGILFYQTDLKIVDMNPALINLTGYTYQDIILKPVTSIIPEEFHTKFKERLAILHKSENLGYWEFELKHKENKVIAVEGFDTLMELGGKTFYVTIVLDITDRKNYQQKIFESIIQTEENERRRFAGDIHDELGPHLASMRLYTSSLKKRITDPEMDSIVDELMDIIKKSIANVREISNNLSPHLLDNYGLAVAVKAEVERKMNFFNINFEQNIEKVRFEKNIEIVFYRTCKELLNNTLKYAEATQVNFLIKHEHNVLYVEYTDNGKGFNYEDFSKSGGKGLGLLNIQSRLSSIQGYCSIQSKPGKGFRLEAKVNTTNI